jgi:cell division transport system ATP-binding protein
MVKFEDVSMIYPSGDTKAIDNMTFTIQDGEFVFLVGPSGSGKTSVIKLITGEVEACEGELNVNGFDLRRIHRGKLPAIRRTIGVIFQDFRLIEDKTVFDNVAFAMHIVGATGGEIRRRVPYVLELVGLTGREKRFPREISGGEQQRVAVARAIVNSPSLLIADEPTGNLDPARSLELMLLMDKINEMGTTVLVVTHEKELVNSFSKRVVAIDGGRVISDGMDGYYSYEIE